MHHTDSKGASHREDRKYLTAHVVRNFYSVVLIPDPVVAALVVKCLQAIPTHIKI